MNKGRFLETVGMVGLGLLFIYAGALKAWNPAHFAQEVYNYRLLPWTGAVAVSLYLPWLEVICGLALVFRKADRGALALVLLLCFVFLGALASAAARGLNISCGCFGGDGSGSIGWAIVRDLFFIATVLALQRRMRRRRDYRPGTIS